MIVLDTSVLVDALTGERRSLRPLAAVVERGSRLLVPCLVLYEWLRGPRTRDELARQRDLFPEEGALSFGLAEAVCAARLYTEVPRARGRDLDLAIAAHAIVSDAALWTLNRRDFSDIPGLQLHESSS